MTHSLNVAVAPRVEHLVEARLRLVDVGQPVEVRRPLAVLAAVRVDDLLVGRLVLDVGE